MTRSARARYAERIRRSGPVIRPKRAWIKRTRRVLYGMDDGSSERINVWRAPVKIGTHPGSFAVFLTAPVEGERVVLIEDMPVGAARTNRPIRGMVDRIDDTIERVFVSRQ